MDKRATLLLLLIVFSAFSIINLRHQSRMSFAELQTLRTERDKLDIEWGRLLLEQGAWSQHQRVEKIAQSRLGMKIPDSRQVVILNTRGQVAMSGGAK